MAEIKVRINNDTEKVFRRSAMHEFGFRKGSISLAANQALGSWALEHENIEKLRVKAKEKIKDPVKSVRGMLKGIKITSVEMQHEVSRIRSARREKHVSDRL